MSAQIELGPVLPSRLAVYGAAVELLALARLAVEFTAPGPHVDLPRAVRQLTRARVLLGEIGGGLADG